MYQFEEPESAISPFVKYTLFFVNFLFWVGGLLLVGVGVWAMAVKEYERTRVVTSVWDLLFDLALILCLLGAIVCILATLGCVGALRENVCLLRTFCVLTLIVILALLAVAAAVVIVPLVLKPHVLSEIEENVAAKGVKHYFDDPDLKDVMDGIQETFQCCGFTKKGYLDWHNNRYFECSTTNTGVQKCGVPHSCCRTEIRKQSDLENFSCGFNIQNKQTSEVLSRIYASGCNVVILDTSKQYIFTIFAIVLAVCLIPTVELCLAHTLVGQINEQKRNWYKTFGRPQRQVVRRPGSSPQVARPSRDPAGPSSGGHQGMVPPSGRGHRSPRKVIVRSADPQALANYYNHRYDRHANR